MKFLSDIRLLLLGIWLGSACFFIAVAQSAFAVLPTGEMAGAVVNRTLSVLNYGGLAIAIVLLLTSLIAGRNANKIMVWAERFLLLLIAIACAVGQFVIGLMLLSVRAQMGKPVDEVALDDPLRIQFNNLHEWSVWVLMAGMGAALIAFFLIANRRSSAAAAVSTGTTTSDPFDFTKEFKKK
jgi:Zn-dependent protease with chaperone function